YLYVFSQTEGKPTKMIFPDARLKGGDNRIRAHRLRELPSAAKGEPQGYKISGGAATERPYLVVTRDPLPNVPTAKDLIAYCASYGVKEWRPDEAIWNAMLNHVGEEVVERRTEVFGRKQSKAESVALTRDMSLDDEDDPPSVRQKSTSPDARLIVTL